MQYLACLPLFFETFVAIMAWSGRDLVVWKAGYSSRLAWAPFETPRGLCKLFHPLCCTDSQQGWYLANLSASLLSGWNWAGFSYTMLGWLRLHDLAGMPHFGRKLFASWNCTVFICHVLQSQFCNKEETLRGFIFKTDDERVQWCEIWPTKLGDCLAGSRPKHSLLTGKAEFQHLSQTKGHNKINVM